MMASETKFLFDYDFDQVKVTPAVKIVEQDDEQEEEEEPEIIVPTFSEEQLQAAKEEAFTAGKEEGILEASTSVEQEIISSLNMMDTKLTDIVHQQSEFNVELNSTAVLVATGVARKCFPEYIKQSGTREIEGMIRELFPQIITEPRIVIHLNPEQTTDIKEKFKKIADQKHYEGKLIIQEDTSVNPGECTVDWSHGRAERNLDDLWQQITSVVERTLGVNIDIPELDENESVLSEDQILERDIPQTSDPEASSVEDKNNQPAENEISEPPLVDQDAITSIIDNAATSLGNNPLDTVPSIDTSDDDEAVNLSLDEPEIELIEKEEGNHQDQVELNPDIPNPQAIDQMPEDAILEPDNNMVMESSTSEETPDTTEDEREPTDSDTTPTT